MFKVAVCAGHGFNTPGKRTPDGEREWSFNSKVVEAFIAELQTYENVEVLRTDDPTGKTDVALSTRTNKANAWGANIYISFHHNANTSKWGDWTGVETFVYTKPSKASQELAEAVHPEIIKAYGLANRGIKKGNLHIVRETHMPAILVEGGFMDSTIDIKKLHDNSVLKNAGIGSATAVAKIGGLKKKAVKVETPVKAPSSAGFQVGAYQKDVIITANSLNARASRDASSKLLGSFKKGEKVNVWYIGKAKDGGLWGSCSVAGRTGFINMAYTDPA